MEKQLIIFDLDGTLIDSRTDLAVAINVMRVHYDLDELSHDEIIGYVGNGARKLVERSLHDSTVNVDEAMAIYRDYYNAHSTVYTTAYEFVEQGLATLSDAGHTLAVLTNKPGNASRHILEAFGLAKYFDTIIGGGDGVPLKPHPDGALLCMKESGSEKESSWMVGDNYTDLEVAENAGIKSIYAAYGFGDPRHHIPTERVNSFRALVELFV